MLSWIQIISSKLFLKKNTSVKNIFFICVISGLNQNVLAAGAEPALKLTPAESLLPMLMGLGGILMVIFLLAMLIKKLTGLNLVSGNIKVIESQSLGAKEKLVIVEIQRQQYVLGVTAHSINKICQLEQPIEKNTSSMSFDKVMKQLLSPQKKLNPKAYLADSASKKTAQGEG